MGQKFVIHIYYKPTKEHRFFGSVAALCAVFDKDKIGIIAPSLTNYFYRTKNKPYKNDFCTIYRGLLERHEQD